MMLSTMHVLYSDHRGWLLAWLRKKIGCPEHAADLTQDTFLRALLKPDDSMREPRAYLFTIARGLLIDHWRKEELQRAWLETMRYMPELSVPSVESRQLVLELLEEIARMLDGLKPKVRTAFLLAQLEGMSYGAIAEQMHVSQRTVERYMAEAFHHCYELRYGSASEW